MPTSAPTNSDPHLPEKPGGFTLFEVVVALAVAALLIGAVVPGFFSLFEPPSRQLHQNLSRALRMLRNDAVLQAQDYVLQVDLVNQALVIRQGREEDAPELQERVLASLLRLPEGVEITDAFTAERGTGVRLTEPESLEVFISAQGAITPFTLVLQEAEEASPSYLQNRTLMGKLTLEDSP